MWLCIFNSLKMSAGKVHNVYIISSTSTVWCIVISAKYCKLLSSSCRNLWYIRHKIIRNSLWVFSNLTWWMCSNWIEITKKYNCKLWICISTICKNLLHHSLSPSIWIRACTSWHSFNIWRLLFSIYCRWRWEYNLLNSCFFHTLKKCKCCINIVTVILGWKSCWLTNCLKSSKMYYTVNLIFCKYLSHNFFVFNISLIRYNTLSSYLFHSLYRFRTTVTVIINYNNIMSCIK